MRVFRRGGKADLVIDDEVNRAAHSVATRVAHRQAFSDDALTSECRVTMHKKWQHAECTRWLDLILHGTHRAEHDGVDGF